VTYFLQPRCNLQLANSNVEFEAGNAGCRLGRAAK
jgi:hypothetical protein